MPAHYGYVRRGDSEEVDVPRQGAYAEFNLTMILEQVLGGARKVGLMAECGRAQMGARAAACVESPGGVSPPGAPRTGLRSYPGNVGLRWSPLGGGLMMSVSSVSAI